MFRKSLKIRCGREAIFCGVAARSRGVGGEIRDNTCGGEEKRKGAFVKKDCIAVEMGVY